MNISLPVIIISSGIILILGLVYLLREKLTHFAINQGISFVQKLVLKIVMTVGDREPQWVLLKYPSAETFTLGLLTQKGEKHSTVYLPTGPRLIPGRIIFINNDKWANLNIDFQEGIKILISLGLLTDSQDAYHKIWTKMEEL